MSQYTFASASMDFLRGDQLDALNSEKAGKKRIKAVKTALPSSSSCDNSTDQAKTPREEEIELRMKNIKEFIRGIDVTSL